MFMLIQTHKRLEESAAKVLATEVKAEAYRGKWMEAVGNFANATVYAGRLERRLYQTTKSHTHVGTPAEFFQVIRKELQP